MVTRMLLQTTLAAEKMGKVWEDETDKILQEMKDHVETQDVQIKKLEDSVDELNEKMDYLKDDLLDEEDRTRRIKKENQIMKEDRDKLKGHLKGMIDETLTGEMKLTIAKNLLKNLSLEQMENLEKHAKESFSHTNKPYVEIPR